MTMAVGTPEFLTRSDRFRAIDRLASGATGDVFRVFDREMGAELALKTVQRPSVTDLYHLKREFRGVAGVVHPNLVRLHELFVEDDACFFTMELVDGVQLDEFVRPKAGGDAAHTVDAERLVMSVQQLVMAVAQLHGSGRVHRDLKPSNVLVTPEGRVVVLDFGFVLPWNDRQRMELEGEFAGTLPYVAPEYLLEQKLGPAADWFSLGVILFELLTGHLPWKAQSFWARRQPLDEAAMGELDSRFAGLVASLLQPDPAQRPDRHQILAALGDATNVASRRHHDALFAGRSAELESLTTAFDRVVSTGIAECVRVAGVSGMGKSTLLRVFAASLSGARVLSSRSHPQESVAYKVFDGALDDLSQLLLNLAHRNVTLSWPEHMAALTRMFPVLRRAHPDSEHPQPEVARDPRDERNVAWSALRRLLSEAARDAPLVIMFDDVQWGDLDSLGLLSSLLTPPLDAPILFVLAYRSEESATSRFLQAFADTNVARTAGIVEVNALDDAAAMSLARDMFEGDAAVEESQILAIVDEAAGSPFFIGELVRHRRGTPHPDGQSASNDVVGVRLAELRDLEHRILETVAAAGRPIDTHTALEAASAPGASLLDIFRLCDSRWLRQTEVSLQPAVETYHDRIRERVLGQLESDGHRLRAIHHALASAIEKRDGDPEVLLFHHESAGNLDAAGRFACAAAERADTALAFERAAELYARALQFPEGGVPRAELHERHGHALTNAGKAVDAARAYERAIEHAPPDAATRILDLKRRAGEHYLRTAHYDEGLIVIGDALEAVGARLPRSHRTALWPSIRQRFQFLFRGIDFTAREASDVPPAKHQRLEVLWSAAISLALLDHHRADPIALTHLLEALDHGDSAQALRALAYEAGVLAGIGGSFLGGRSERIQTAVMTMAEQRGVPYERAWARLAVGSSAWFVGQWRKCVDFCDQGATIFREQCRGVSWELATMEMFGLSALGIIGDLEQLSHRLPEAIRVAEERGDLFRLNNCRLGQPSVLWLALGRPEELRELARRADHSMWKGGYHTHRYHYAFAMGQADLYDGDPWSCLDRLDEHWPGLKASRILYLQWPQLEMRHLRARAKTLAARLLRDGERPPARHRKLRVEKLLNAVDQEARTFARRQLLPAAALAAALRAGAAAVRRSDDREVLCLAAAQACRAADMDLLAAMLSDPTHGSSQLRQALGIPCA
jgi:eukaryotic-like serine/threonine-protein kinase